MKFITGEEISKALKFEELIAELRSAFQESVTAPMRHHHDYANPQEEIDSTLLLMPAWEAGKDLGVKLVTVSPNNGKFNLPAVQGIYILWDAHQGTPTAVLEAKTLTKKRTAAASALASSFLSRPESSSLLMIGTGSLAPELIQAHSCVRNITQLFIWGRSPQKARAVKEGLDLSAKCQAVEDYREVISEVDIISCATLSKEPLVFGDQLKPGQHVDLVGAYKTDMREADDQTVMKSAVFVDTMAGMRESGDIKIPLENGLLVEEDIRADLFKLCRGEHDGRLSDQEITMFKSVGHAIEDLAAARLVQRRLRLR